MKMSNSHLVCYTDLSPNHSGKRNHKIDTITIHCMAGNLSVEVCGNVFKPKSRQASSQYGIGSDGRIALYCDESNRSWCSSSASNDHRAITIEVANCTLAPDYKITTKAYDSLVNLCYDICKRNGIKRLLWKGDKSLVGQIEKQNMTCHRWFANKSCPGNTLYNLHYQIAEDVNELLEKDKTIKIEGVDTGMTKDELKVFIKEILKEVENSKVKDETVSEWAKESLEKGKELGITDGTRPKEYATREEVITMIVRSLDK